MNDETRFLLMAVLQNFITCPNCQACKNLASELLTHLESQQLK